jgi:PAS domain S-box-containing protein
MQPHSARRRRFLPLVATTVVVVAAGAAWGSVRAWRPAVPDRPLLIGFEHNPPYQIRNPSGPPSGLVIDTVAEAARRKGLALRWQETSGGPEKALTSGGFDLWPLVTDLPERRRVLYISAPWLQSQHVLVLLSSARVPTRDFAGTLSITAVAIHARLLAEHFPAARHEVAADGSQAVERLCRGAVEGAFLESRLALAVLRERPEACAGADLRARLLPGLHALGVGSTPALSAAADRIRDGISDLARDGTLAVLMARYSFFGLGDTQATYDLLEARERNRRLRWAVAALAAATGALGWLSLSLRASRRRERETLTRYRVASRAASDAIWELDLRTHQVRWSEAFEQIYGGPVPALETSLEWWQEHVHPDDVDRVRRRFAAAVERGNELAEDELRLRRADGTYARVVVRGFPVDDGPGQPVRMIGALLDVTRRRELEADLLQAQRMEAVGRLAGGVAHDFNNLLMAIMASARLAARRAAADERVAGYVAEIELAAERAAELTRQLLALGRRQTLRPEVIGLNDVLADSEGLLRRLLGERVGLLLRPAEDLLPVRADKGQVGQVLMNLCLNGRDAMPSGGRLTVETANVRRGEARPPEIGDDGDWVVLRVRDEGSGMDEETRRRLFEPFFTRKESGTGLGLSSSYGIVKQSGGHIVVETEPGRGSAFSVYLPAIDPPRG